MDPFPEILRDRLVAFAASVGNIEMVNRGAWIGRAQNPMRTALALAIFRGMTVSTAGGCIQSLLRRLTMHTALISLDRRVTQHEMLLHQVRVGVTVATGARKTGRMHVGLMIG